MKVPKLRFPEFNEEWEENKLGDIGNFKNGVNKDKSDFGKGFPFVNLMDVFGKNSIYKTDFDLVNANQKELKESNLIKGDVLFIRSSVKPSGVGLTAVINENLDKTVYSGFLIRFREKKKIFDHDFKKYCFYTNKFRNSLMRKSSTSANTNINQESLNKLVIHIPSLSEQEKIASFLSKVDEKIGFLEKKQELWEMYKNGMMQQLFSHELRFKDENGENYPVWEEKKLGDIITASSSNLSINNLEDNHGIYPLYGAIGFMKNIDFYKNDEKYIAIVKDGAGVGRTMLCDEKSSILGTMQYLDSKDQNDLIFCYYLLSTLNFKKYVIGSTIPHIYYKDYSKENVFVPSYSEQQKIAHILSNLDFKIDQMKKENIKTQKFKKGLLQQLFC